MKIWVTREEKPGGPLSSAFDTVGLKVLLEPVLRRRVVTDAADVISRLGRDDWLVLTSLYAIEAIALEPARVPRVAVVGEASRRAAVERGFRVELVSSDGTGRTLFEQLRSIAPGGVAHAPGCVLAPGGASGSGSGSSGGRVSPDSRVRPARPTCKVCHPRSSLAAAPEPWSGVELLSPVLYETVPRPFDRGVIRRVDAVCVVSPSAVEAIGPVDLPFASIGPTTTTAIRGIGKEPWVEAATPSFEELALAVASRRL